MKRDLNSNLSGNQVYYTNSLLLLVKNMLCSKLYRQKGFNLNPFSYKMLSAGGGDAGGADDWGCTVLHLAVKRDHQEVKV